MVNIIIFLYIAFSVCLTAIGISYIISYIKAVAEADDRHATKEQKALWTNVARSKRTPAFMITSLGTSMLVAGTMLEWGAGSGAWFAPLLCAIIAGATIKFSPKSPEGQDVYFEIDFQLKIRTELQKLLGRVGALQTRASAVDDPYRTHDALAELEEYLKNRIK